MSRHVRERVTAAALGGVLLGVPLLTNGTAVAGQKSDPRLVAATSAEPPPARAPSIKKAGVPRVPTHGLSLAAPARPAPDGLIGLLAAVSMVLVTGVSAGVIRTIVSERASRTNIA
jgi:hypothetical protein